MDGKEVPASLCRFSTVSVLCVDDDPTYLEITKKFLEEPGKLTITTALSVPEALKEMKTNRFDAVVADYQMPVMNGIEFLRAVRAENPSLPFILFTGKGREEVVIEAFNSGVDFYLQKTGEPKILFATLKDTIKKAVKSGEVRKEFHNSETRYRRLFETANDGILILDAESGIITDANPLLLTLLGYTRDEIMGKNIWDLGVIREKSLAEKAAAELKKTGYIRFDDLPLKTKDGRDIAVEFVSKAYDAETQKVIQINIREIAERKRAEQTLRESEARYNALFFNNYSVSLLIDPDTGMIVDANNAAERYYGYSRDQLLSKAISDLNRQPRDTVVRNLMRAKGEKAKHFFSTHYLAGGEKRSVEVFSGPITVQGKTLFYSIIHDISDREQAVAALALSEVRNRTVLENVPDLILVHRNGVILYTNPPAAEITGYTNDELNNKQLIDFVVPEARVLVAQAILRREDGKTIEPYEIEILTKSGMRRTVIVRGTLIEFDGSPASLNVLTDITERKQAVAALARSEERYRTLAEASPDQIFINGRDGTIQYVNTAVLKLFHLPFDQVVGKLRKDLFPPESFKLQEASLQKVFDTGESYRKEDKIQFGTKELWIDTNLVPLKDEAGIVTSVLGIARDITERKQAETSLRETKDYLENLIRYANVPIISWNPELKITEFNRAFEQLNGMTREEVIGQPLAILFTDKTREKSMDLIRRAISGEHWEVVEIPIRHVSGETRIVLWNSANILDPTGTVIATIAQGQDITDRKAAEEAIKTFSEDLDRKVLERTSDLGDVNMKLMTEIDVRLNAERQLTKTVGEKEVMLREVHHRVKNNLQIIISLLNLQSRYITDETTLSAFRESQNRVRAMALVHEKLYRSTDLATIDLDNYIRYLANNLLQFFGVKGKGITLTMDIHDIFLAIDTAIPFGLMINELISNSLKYAFPGGRTGEISIAIHRQDHTLTILYKDNGVGIEENFDWRNAKSMGLQLVTALVDQLDGTIELDRTGGTRFTMVVQEKVVQEKEQQGSS